MYQITSIGEQKAIDANNQNPFVDSKQYNPLDVVRWVITYLQDGEVPTTVEGEEQSKDLYIATLEFLQKQGLEVNESNIIAMKEKILEFVDSMQEAASEEGDVSSVTIDADVEKESQDPADEHKGCLCQYFKHPYVRLGAILLAVLLIIKILK
jgi:hypothetical protein